MRQKFHLHYHLEDEVGSPQLCVPPETFCLVKQNFGMCFCLRYSRMNTTFKPSIKELTPSQKISNALMTPLVLRVSTGVDNHLPSGETAVRLPPIQLKKIMSFKDV